MARRAAVSFISFATALCFVVQPAAAQALNLIRDTEIERVLKSYEDPFLNAAGLDPAAFKVYLLNDPTVNSFAAGGQNIFIQTGMIMYVDKPNELKGVMAHETGHVAGGDLTRDSSAIAKASVPMLISMAAGLIAMVAGAGEAGMGIMMAGQQIAEGQFMAFSRVQEATADQRGMKYLTATHQSGRGMLHVFERFADEEAMATTQIDTFARDHPASRDRVAALQALVDASPYKDAEDSPADLHEYKMIKAKLSGYLEDVPTVLNRYPITDTSDVARYARAMAYFRQPNMKMALAEINSLIKDEPKNPYFYEVLGQIYVEMSRPVQGIAPYQKAVDLLPDAPLLRIDLAAAQLATENKQLAQAALDNLKIAMQQENDNAFGWYQMAQAYSDMNNEPMANLATAERFYAVGSYPEAGRFAALAQRNLMEGSPDWQRAVDIMSAAGPAAKKQHDDQQ